MPETSSQFPPTRVILSVAALQGDNGGSDRIEAFIQLTYYMGDIDERGDFRTLEVETLKAKTVETEALDVGGVNILDRLTKLEEELNNLKRN